MAWLMPRYVAPMISRIEPPATATERDLLVAFLDYYRATLQIKAQGLTDEQASMRSCPPSELTIVGLIRHSAEVERYWFDTWWRDVESAELYSTAAEPAGDLLFSGTVSLSDALATLRAEIARSQESIAGVTDLDLLARHAPVAQVAGQPASWQPSLRWILIHLVEEYARHCGHADLLREAIDGETGD